MYKLFIDKYTGKQYLVPTIQTRATVYQYPANCKVWSYDQSSSCSRHDIGSVCFKTRSNLSSWLEMMNLEEVK